MATRLTRFIRPVFICSPSPTPTTTTSTSRSISRSLALRLSSTSSFPSGPAPPRLPPDEQAEFERLQRTANTEAGFTATSSADLSSPTSTASPTSTTSATSATNPSPQASSSTNDTDTAVGAEPVATPLRKGAPPDFEGNVNPRTGEVGGPKNEPLRWGAGGDYSFNGRVTDF
ncbi:DUF1674-domain-containing protein [Nemania serpens]|nr:DUF1674-domain-containing protein [Nemania serpens]